MGELVKRIDIYYGGERYSVGMRTFEDVSAQIFTALRSGGDWIEVNQGDGAPRTAYLLISPGVDIAILPIPETGPEPTISPSGW